MSVGNLAMQPLMFYETRYLQRGKGKAGKGLLSEAQETPFLLSTCTESVALCGRSHSSHLQKLGLLRILTAVYQSPIYIILQVLA